MGIRIRHVEFVCIGDGVPKVEGGTAQRMDAEFDPRLRDGRHIDDVLEIGDVGSDVIGGVDRWWHIIVRHGDASHVLCALREDVVCARLDPFGDGGVGGPARRRVVFKSAIDRGIMARRNDDAIGSAWVGIAQFGIMAEYGMADDGGWRIAVVTFIDPGLDDDFDVVCRQNFDSRHKSGLAERMAIHSQKERSVDVFFFSVFGNGLRDGDDMHLVERTATCDATMSTRSERDPTRGIGHVGFDRIIIGDESCDVNSVVEIDLVTCIFVDSHRLFL